MLQVYFLTVCDTVSDLYEQGKKTAVRIMMKEADMLQVVSSIGLGPLTYTQKKPCTEFVVLMYGQPNGTSFNNL